MSQFIHKSHNVSVLIYHLVCPAKYRKVVFTSSVDEELKEICLEISNRFEITFLEIGTDKDHVHFLVQSVPALSPSRVSQIIKSLTAREIFKRIPEVKEKLWGGEFWSKGFFINSVGLHGNEKTIAQYVKNQGTEKDYKMLHQQQLDLW